MEEEDVADVIIEFFKELFTSDDVVGADEAIEVVQGRVIIEQRETLNQVFTRKKVFTAIMQMHLLKGPRFDDLLALFHHTFWHVVRDDVTNLMLEFLNNGTDMEEMNYTYICLISKVKKPKHSRDFRPISLCNVIFKITTNTITNRIKLILPYTMGPYQSAFVLGKLITNNALIAFEIFHYIRKKKIGNVSVAGLKLDMAKAYDRIEWAFLERVLRCMGFLTIGYPSL